MTCWVDWMLRRQPPRLSKLATAATPLQSCLAQHPPRRLHRRPLLPLLLILLLRLAVTGWTWTVCLPWGLDRVARHHPPSPLLEATRLLLLQRTPLPP